MNINVILEYFSKYGLIFLFIVVFIEHLNCPGVPATIVLPTIGAFVSETKNSLLLVILISIGYYIGTPILDCLNKKIPKTEKYTEKILMYSNKYGNKAIFICRLLPVIRTLISLVSGVVRAEFGGFVLYSTMGISIWNIVLLSFGYFGVKVIIH